VLMGRGRRPEEVITRDMDVTQFIGRFWELDDFKGISPELWDLLIETDWRLWVFYGIKRKGVGPYSQKTTTRVVGRSLWRRPETTNFHYCLNTNI
jgi:hypothetical protein